MSNGDLTMSRQDLLDDPAAACPQLRQFFGAYFHQDWMADRDGWEEVVDDFIEESPRSVVIDTTQELRDLLATDLTESELATVLERLDGSVVPGAARMTTTEWLEAVLQRLGSTG